MIWKDNKSLGIDISETHISFALLKKSAGGFSLLKADQISMPAGAVTNGNLTSPQLLSKAVRELLKKNKVKQHQAAISLLANPVLSQIVDVPEHLPDNIDQFIRSEIKNSSILTRREYNYDFSFLGESSHNGVRRILVQAANNEKILPVIKALNQASIEVSVIELPITAWSRAVYEKHMKDNFKKDILAVYARNSQTYICVFRKRKLDFIRSIEMGHLNTSSDDYIAKCRQQINAVMQFYDLEVEVDNEMDWELLLYLDQNALNAKEIHSNLQSKLRHDISLCSDSQINQGTSVKNGGAVKAASMTAIGLAIRKLRSSATNNMIDLVPRQIKEMKMCKDFTITTGAVAAAALVLVMLFASIIGKKAAIAEMSMSQRKENDPVGKMAALLEQQHVLDDSIALLQLEQQVMAGEFGDEITADWHSILEDISANIPSDLSIVSMDYAGNDKFTLYGDALSYEATYLYAKLLEKSGNIASAVVAKANNNSQRQGFISYQINCRISNDRSDR